MFVAVAPPARARDSACCLRPAHDTRDSSLPHTAPHLAPPPRSVVRLLQLAGRHAPLNVGWGPAVNDVRLELEKCFVAVTQN